MGGTLHCPLARFMPEGSGWLPVQVGGGQKGIGVVVDGVQGKATMSWRGLGWVVNYNLSSLSARRRRSWAVTKFSNRERAA